MGLGEQQILQNVFAASLTEIDRFIGLNDATDGYYDVGLEPEKIWSHWVVEEGSRRNADCRIARGELRIGVGLG